MGGSGGAAAWEKPLSDGFEGSDFSPEGGLYYRKNYEQTAGKVEFQNKVVHTGNGALRLSVRPLCPPADEECSERAEVWQLTKLWAPYDRGVWNGFAVKFDDPVPMNDHHHVIAQWKRQVLPGATGDHSPFLALRLNRGRLYATVETNLVIATRKGAKGTAGECGPGETAVWLRPDTNQTRALVAVDEGFRSDDGVLFNSCTDKIVVTDRGNKLPEPGSGWIDFAIYTKPGPDGTGHIEIFANGKWIASVKGQVGHADEPGLGDRQYFKFGPYRSGGQGEWALYYDDFRRSPNCKDVLQNGACPF
jgi:hypothetical protein